MDLCSQEVQLSPPYPDIDNWSENFALSSFDPVSGIGIWLHLGRWRRDLTLWRETIVVTWPDGTVSGYRSFGNALVAEDGPGGAGFAIRIIEPRRKLSYSFLGGVQRVPAAQLVAGPLADGPRHRLRLALSFAGIGDLWDMSKAGGTQAFTGKGHIEQVGQLTGTIEFDRETFHFDARANRDHSMGPRDSATLGTHLWSQAYFENGINVLIYDAVVRGAAAPAVSEAAVYDGGILYDAMPKIDWRLQHFADRHRGFGISLTYAKGTLDIATAGFVNDAYLSFTGPNDHYIGVCQGGDPPLTLLEQPVRFTLNGNIRGYGWMERTVPGVITIDP